VALLDYLKQQRIEPFASGDLIDDGFAPTTSGKVKYLGGYGIASSDFADRC
jgi:hypothetical protein